MRRTAQPTQRTRKAATLAGIKVQPAAALPALSNVANISAIVRQPNSEIVDVSYNQLVPRQMEGSLDDPQIRQLLMLATENNSSPGVRDDSVALLAAECRAGHSCQPAGIREALMVALRYDRSPKVRQKALEGLEPYVADDVRVRDAVLEAVLNDNDPAIRTAAIGLLEPVDADTSVRQVLYSVSNSDDNPQIRNVSRQVLAGFRKPINSLTLPATAPSLMSADRTTNCKERHNHEAPFEAVPYVAWNLWLHRTPFRRTLLRRAHRGSLLALYGTVSACPGRSTHFHL